MTDREIMQEESVQEVGEQSPEHKTDREIMLEGSVQQTCSARSADIVESAGSAGDDAADHKVSTCRNARNARKKAKKKEALKNGYLQLLDAVPSGEAVRGLSDSCLLSLFAERKFNVRRSKSREQAVNMHLEYLISERKYYIRMAGLCQL